MSRLVFNNSEALKCLAKGTLNAKEFRLPYTDKHTEDKGVLFVKDSGIYLMNAYAGESSPHELGTVVFAESFDPAKDEDVWERSREAVGGDDFGEFLDFPEVMLKAILADKLRKLIINMGKTSYSMEFELD